MAHWAILVGVLYYGPHREEDNRLKGCVADVEDMKEFLELQIVSDKIFQLTSSLPKEGTEQPPEQSDKLATSRNFKKCVRHVIDHGRESDNVYIHYSGHGGKRSDDICLNFYTPTQGSSQLSGEIVAKLIKEMVNKKMLVTVAFDCCFSGATKRGSAQRLRFSNYIEPVEDSDCLCSPNDSLGNTQSNLSAFRSSRVIPQWITNPQGFTIFCACTSSQIANEVCEMEKVGSPWKDAEVERALDPEYIPVVARPIERGALSYMLLGALKQLRKTDIAVTDGSLFEHLRARFHARIPNQTPILYGSKQTSFFAKISPLPSPNITSVFKQDGQLILKKGSAHGVLLGDRYTLFPLQDSAKASDRVMRPRKVRGAEGDCSLSSSAEKFAIFKVTVLRGLTSVLQVDEKEESIDNIEDGWMAYPLTQMNPRLSFVQLLTEDRSEIEWQKASEDLAHLQILRTDGDVKPCTYNVTINIEKQYQICDLSEQPIQSVPCVPLDQVSAKYRVVELLDHITTYKYIESIENRIGSQSLSSSFRAEMYVPEDEARRLAESVHLEVSEQEVFRFEIENLSEDDLYVYLYTLGPDWSIIDQLTLFRSGEMARLGPSSSGPGNRFSIDLRAELLQESRSRNVASEEEVYKLFVTRRPDSFAGLRMDAISNSPSRGALRTLRDFLAARRDRRRSGGDGDEDHSEDWFTKNFIVKTRAFA